MALQATPFFSSFLSFPSFSLSSQSSPFVWYWLYNFLCLCLWCDIWMKPCVALDLLCTNKLALQGPEGYTGGSCHHKFNIIEKWPRLAKFQEKAENNTQTTANYVSLLTWVQIFIFFGNLEIEYEIMNTYMLTYKRRSNKFGIVLTVGYRTVVVKRGCG